MIIMQAIKVKIKQQTATFRKPTARVYQETYPLPPFSTVVGFLHKIAGFTTYHDMKLSVQGSFQSKTIDLATQHFLTNSNTAKNNTTLFPAGGGVTKGIANIELLVNLETIVHIVPEDTDDLQIIFDALKQPNVYPALGRYEDLAVLSDIEIVELIEDELEEDRSNQYAAYIPKELIDDVIGTKTTGPANIARNGTYFTIPKVYTADSPLSERKWKESYDVVYTSNFTMFADEPILVDPDGLPVFLV